MPGRRNTIAMNPLLRKGGVHQRSRTASRRNENRNLEDILDEWLEESSETDETATEANHFIANEHG